MTGKRTSLKYNLDRSRTGDSYSYYDMAHGVDGYVAMFEATGDEGYLDEALGRLIDNAISDATPSLTLGPLAFKDSYKGWISHHSEVAGQEVAFYESYLWRYVCRLVRALRSNKSTYGQSGYRRQYDAILAFTEANIFDKWYVRGVDRYIYRQNTNMAAHWAYVALHLRLHTNDAVRQARCYTIHNTSRQSSCRIIGERP